MFDQLPTHRLSPKNQVTLPRGNRGLPGVDASGLVFALPHQMRLDDGARLPVVVFLVEEELRQREERIRAREDITAAAKERRIAILNGHVRQLAVDGQRRVVLPRHFVELLRLEREVFMFPSNNSVMLWNPSDWLRYTADQEDDDSDDLML